MLFVAIILLTISAAIHALWNLLSKGQKRPSKEFLFLANVIGCICCSPSLFISGLSYHFSFMVFELIILTGFFEAVYFSGVAKSYYHGDISIAYPIMRSLPIVLVIFFSALVMHNMAFKPLFIVGSILVIMGCISTAITNLSEFRIKYFINYTNLYAYIAAIASAGYLITDNYALQALHQLNPFSSLIKLSIIYSFIRVISISCWMAIMVVFKQSNRMHTYEIIKRDFIKVAIAGISMYLSYTLVLLSMYLTQNVSYVTVFRLFSIPLTVIAGIYLFNETKYFTKIFGIALILFGLILVTLG